MFDCRTIHTLHTIGLGRAIKMQIMRRVQGGLSLEFAVEAMLLLSEEMTNVTTEEIFQSSLFHAQLLGYREGFGCLKLCRELAKKLLLLPRKLDTCNLGMHLLSRIDKVFAECYCFAQQKQGLSLPYRLRSKPSVLFE